MTATMDQPVRSENRIELLDLIRGLAVLMIFAVNVKVMAGPFQAYMNPDFWNGPMDRELFALASVLVEFKFITIFSALFGAGLALVADKADGAGVKGRLRARLFFLLIFGLVHGFFIWVGDILTSYAVAGFFAALLIRKRAKALWTWGVALLALGWIMQALFGLPALLLPEAAEEMIANMWDYESEEARALIAGYGGGVFDQLSVRAPEYGFALIFVLLMLPRTLGLMVLGAALLKSGFLRGDWSAAAYAKGAGLGLGLGLGLETIRVVWLNNTGWSYENTAILGPLAQYWSSLLAAFGYASLIAWAAKTGMTARPLAAAGRMAFSNYIACSLIGTTIFNGHGLGLIGEVTLAEALALVLATWVAILIWSPLWLSRFRFGPLEWLWRSLTYGRAQPMAR